MVGGEGGIRTPDTVARTPHFECGAFNHSATSPWPQGDVERPPPVARYVTNSMRRDKGGRRYFTIWLIQPIIRSAMAILFLSIINI